MTTRTFSIIFVTFVGLVDSQVSKSKVENYDYCDPKLKLCDVPADHVMCKYPVPGLSDKCTPAVHEPLSTKEKKLILFWHNKFRSNIAIKNEGNSNKKLPTSSNMRQLEWDRELELLAERWAQQCVSFTSSKVYDKCRNIRRFPVSQNVGTRRMNGTTFDKQAPQIMIMWFKESKDFLPSYVDKFPALAEDKVTAKQFANMIWAETYAIGCARVIFRENISSLDKGAKKITTWTVERLICNYGPSGNMVGKSVYKRGASCESCPKGTECSQDFPGLCATLNADMSEGQKNVESQGNKESNDRTTHQISVQSTSKAKDSKGGDEQEQKILNLEDGEEDEEEEVGEAHTTRLSDLIRVNEILNNLNTATAHRKTTMTKETQKWTNWKDKKKVKRDAATQKPTRSGDKCACYTHTDGKHCSASRMDVGLLFLFCAPIVSRLFLL